MAMLALSIYRIKFIGNLSRRVSILHSWLSVWQFIPLEILISCSFHLFIFTKGETGLGKSTFINSLFLSELYNQEFPGTNKRKKKTVTVDSTTVVLTEKGVNLRLTIVDTPGYGENIDNSNCWQPVIDYIDLKYEEYLNQESRVNRKQIVDDRVHCCLYFISPGHS